MMVRLTTHIGVTRPQWVNPWTDVSFALTQWNQSLFLKCVNALHAELFWGNIHMHLFAFYIIPCYRNDRRFFNFILKDRACLSYTVKSTTRVSFTNTGWFKTSTGIKAWISIYIHIKQWDVITHPWPNFNSDEWVITPHTKQMDVIIYPCPNLSWPMLVKGTHADDLGLLSVSCLEWAQAVFSQSQARLLK